MYKGLYFLAYGHVEGSPIESLAEKHLDLPFDLETCPCKELWGGGLVKDDIGSAVPPTAAFRLCCPWPVLPGGGSHL